MENTETITIKINAESLARLNLRAEELETTPEEIIQGIVDRTLDDISYMTPDEQRERGMRALAELRAYRERLPESAAVDVVQLIREGRDERDRDLAEVLGLNIDPD